MTIVDPAALAWKELNDSGNADRFVARAGGLLVHVRGLEWVAYDQSRWSAEDGGRLAQLKAMEVARGMRDEIEALALLTESRTLPSWLTAEMLEERITSLRKHAVTSGNAPKTKAMMDQAAALPELNRHRDEFDRDPLAINCANRTLRFEEGPDGWSLTDSDHDPVDLLTRVCSTNWEPGAVNTAWIDFMKEVLPDPEVRWFTQKLMGYIATGKTDEQIFILLQGKGGDGKSTMINVLRTVLGDYAVVGNVKTFLTEANTGAGAATPELVRFVGDTRLISLQEPKRGQALAEERVKQFTGGSPVTYRANYGDEGEFEPRGKVIMEVNARPRISGDDDGIWRRIVIVLFPRQFKGTARVKGMDTKLLAAGRPGILNWLLDGIHGYLREGLEPPKAVSEAIEEYRRSANPFAEWMAARVDTSDPLALTLASDLYADYKEWCEGESVGERETLSQTKFGTALGDRQIMLGPRSRTGKKQRRGARIRDVNAAGITFDDDDIVP
ncbi:DNA primase family protein [Sphingomonas sp. Leaf4]|uniref:DNA primase family protein n=1 Tax=Sphingomonas sp. Leaf4 TaxID=2876553 RepID=UPI001E61F623|nr:phage/plasmid primase, P4 family [Sphingomonas sp. Leaf4]